MRCRILLFILAGFVSATGWSAVITDPAQQIVDIRFSGRVNPDHVFFGGTPHGILAPWADSSVPVEGRVLYAASPNLDYYYSTDEGPGGPGQFQTNYYLNQGLGHLFRFELRIGSLEVVYDLATGQEFSGGVFILTQDPSRQRVSIFSDGEGLTPLLPRSVYYSLTLTMTDDSFPFGLFPPEQLDSPFPAADYPEFGEVTGWLYLDDFDGTSNSSGLGFVVDAIRIVPEPSVLLLGLLGLAPLSRRRRSH